MVYIFYFSIKYENHEIIYIAFVGYVFFKCNYKFVLFSLIFVSVVSDKVMNSCIIYIN